MLNNIIRNKKIQGGIPCVQGTRVPVSSILLYLAQGWTADKIIDDYKAAGVPLKKTDIQAALEYTEEHLD